MKTILEVLANENNKRHEKHMALVIKNMFKILASYMSCRDLGLHRNS